MPDVFPQLSLSETSRRKSVGCLFERALRHQIRPLMTCTAIQAATIAIARVQSKFSMSITSCKTHCRFIQG